MTVNKNALAGWEPWKAMAVAAAAGATIILALIGVISFFTPRPAIQVPAQVIQLPPGTTITVPPGRAG